MCDHVLGRFNDNENAVMRDMLGEASEACRDYVTLGIAEAMNRHNN
ncbi:MAG: hypothetical protein K2K09_06930 [Lachnospiraceae bacterium]|nr:hypothetical protein [Lachnospiraceae bacterium]